MKEKKIFALVLGGYINGYSIIKELFEMGVQNIILFDDHRSLGSFSNKIDRFERIKNDPDGLKSAILNLRKDCDYIVVYPTNDLHLENLSALHSELVDFCHLPFNQKNIISSLDKNVQYSYCENHNVPYPKTKYITSTEELDLIEDLLFPLIMKPSKRYPLSVGVFRNILIKDVKDLNRQKDLINSFLNKGIVFIVSEYIPGDDANIHAYVCYRSAKGKILNEWIGKKLTQHPDSFGVFSSASNTSSDIVREQGRKLMEVMDLQGICEPEFKYDPRDEKFKLMEINLRSMMWHRLGNISGVHLQYTQYLDAIGEQVKKEKQNLNGDTHFVYMKHEISNIIFRRKYWKHFKENVFGAKHRYFAIYDKEDLKPFFYDFIGLSKALIRRCQRVLKGN